jgi:hypothetical protein
VYCLPILYAFQAALIFSLMLLLFSIFTFSWLSNKFFLTMHEGKMQTSLSIQVVHALSYNTISLSLSLSLSFVFSLVARKQINRKLQVTQDSLVVRRSIKLLVLI